MSSMALPSHAATSAAATWLRRIMWIGIAANFVLSVPTLLAPVWVLSTFSLPVPSEIMWTRFSALLLILLSVFYMPAAIDRDRYRASALIAVASRLAGVLFFFLVHRDYWMLGAFDLMFLIPQGLLLRRMRPH